MRYLVRSTAVVSLTSVSLMMATAGCGASSTVQSAHTSSPTTTAAPSTAPVLNAPTPATTAAAARPQPPRTINSGSYNLASGYGGYKAKLTWQVGAPEHISALAPLPVSGRSSLAACQVNSSTDAAVPFWYTLSNTTPKFPSPVTLWVRQDLNTGAFNLLGDDVVGGSGVCGNPAAQSPLTAVSWGNIDPDQDVNWDLFIILQNYYLPSKPSGDLNALKQACIMLQVGFGSNGETILDPKPFSDLSKQVFSLNAGGVCGA